MEDFLASYFTIEYSLTSRYSFFVGLKTTTQLALDKVRIWAISFDRSVWVLWIRWVLNYELCGLVSPSGLTTQVLQCKFAQSARHVLHIPYYTCDSSCGSCFGNWLIRRPDPSYKPRWSNKRGASYALLHKYFFHLSSDGLNRHLLSMKTQ